jgi:hypothetical protein
MISVEIDTLGAYCKAIETETLFSDEDSNQVPRIVKHLSERPNCPVGGERTTW